MTTPNDYPETGISSDGFGQDANHQINGESSGLTPGYLMAASLTEDFVVDGDDEAKELAEELFGEQSAEFRLRIEESFNAAVDARVASLMEAQLAPVLAENEELTLKLLGMEQMRIQDSVCQGLALTQRERLLKITEDLGYAGDWTEYGTKLKMVRDQLFPKRVGTSVDEGATYAPEPAKTDRLVNASANQLRKLFGTNG
jgi:hypothetical protein